MLRPVRLLRPHCTDKGPEDIEEAPNPWAPFQSEMDWRFASWAVQEGLSQGSVDRVLEIPGVSSIALQLKLYVLTHFASVAP
ncbi:uncharacterized protein B0H18DRAFT_885983 [Fomitopsis serialis]|uniref:uncharacterized protein n=1 Tax=Fomitopsis serialis TaxID=139415 RepID=UPI0020074B59|nr:uncharacterized protein B0H18DRAFT_885983 [Neoantrodia serialis]KAH9915369.1 hypothetical protein B0H18DRAFT_885983 [Neoantrodia serialis]